MELIDSELEPKKKLKPIAEQPETPVGGSLSMGEEALLCWAVSVRPRKSSAKDTNLIIHNDDIFVFFKKGTRRKEMLLPSTKK